MTDLFFTKPFEYFHNMIINDMKFKYSRYNDGELIAIIGKTPDRGNCDGHRYFPEMSAELKTALLNYRFDDKYILESFDYWYTTLPHVKQVLDELKTLNPELSFLHTDFIRISHEQTSDKYLSLLNTLKEKNVVIVGPSYLEKLDKFFDFNYINVPLKNCYLDRDRIIATIKNLNNKSDNKIFLFSSSMPTKIFIEAFKEDDKNTYIDWGSVWDTFFVSPEYNFIRKRSTSNYDKYKLIYSDYLI